MTNSRTEAENLEHPATKESKETTKRHMPLVMSKGDRNHNGLQHLKNSS